MSIGYVNVFVKDLAGAVEFYQQKLGLKLELADAAHGYASFEAGPIRLGLAVAGDEQPELVGRHTGVGLVTGDLVADHARLEAAGVVFTVPPTRQPWGGFMATFADPDGNVFYLDEVSAAHG
jgi:predicted enzyme related to lactoylglutathione lyase